jgi:hypothetical protein
MWRDLQQQVLHSVDVGYKWKKRHLFKQQKIEESRSLMLIIVELTLLKI